MGYQLVVWEGEKPQSDAAAGEVCRELMDRYYVRDGVEPTPAIREFVAALTAVWTDDWTGPAGDDSPWKISPLIDEASGPLLFLNLRFGRGEKAAFLIAEMAEERGLVTFDTYVEVMRPCPKKVIDDWTRDAWSHVANLAASLPQNRRSPDGYQLIIWEGERPESDEAGRSACDEIKKRYFTGDPAEPTAGIRKFVAALTDKWTDDPNDPRWDVAPWIAPHLIEDASGPALWITVFPDEGGVLAGCVIAAMAEEHGLVMFDPEAGFLRPVSEAVMADYARRWASAHN